MVFRLVQTLVEMSCCVEHTLIYSFPNGPKSCFKIEELTRRRKQGLALLIDYLFCFVFRSLGMNV